MAKKTVLDFTEILSILADDIVYVLRGTGSTRDKKMTIENLINSFFSDLGVHSSLYVTSNGEVGIGTSSPDGMLGIEKDINSGLTSYIHNLNTGTGAYSVFRLGNNTDSNSHFAMFQLSSGFTTTGAFVADASVLVGYQAPGLNLVAGHTSGEISFYSGGVGSANLGMKLAANSALLVDTLKELTPDAGVTIEGIRLRDSIMEINSIGEATPAAGVIVDGVLLKDAEVYTDTINEKTSDTGVTIDDVLLKDGAIQTDGTLLKTKVINIPSWDMQGTSSISFAHGLADWKKVRGVDIQIINDAENAIKPLNGEGGDYQIDTTNIQLMRSATGVFNQATYNDPGIVPRGWVTITYEA